MLRAWLRKTIRRGFRPPDLTDFGTLQRVDGGLQSEYEKLVLQHVRRLGVPPSCASVSVREIDRHQNRGVYVALVRLQGWERDAALRLLLGLPRLDKKVRESVRAHWVSEVSYFEGVWLQATDELHGNQALSELRSFLLSAKSS